MAKNYITDTQTRSKEEKTRNFPQLHTVTVRIFSTPTNSDFDNTNYSGHIPNGKPPTLFCLKLMKKTT